MNALLAQALIKGQALVGAVIMLIVFGVIAGLLYWLIDFCKVVEPFRTVARVALAIASVLVVINALLTLVGRPIIGW